MHGIQPSRPSPAGPAGPGQAEHAILLLGHGSHLSPESARPIRALARELRRRGGFDEVRVAFWKEDPHLHHALDTVECRAVFVVPVFTSTGYFTDLVVPRELGRSQEWERRARGQWVHLCDPVGTHPGMADLVLARALETGAAATGGDGAGDGGGDASGDGGGDGGGPDAIALVVVGHGTPRHHDSGRTTRELVEALRPRWRRGPVASAFLDEDPRVEDVIRSQEVDRVVVVPFFISEGWHAGVTLPGGLGLEAGRGDVDGIQVRYARPVGTHPALADLVLDLVGAAQRAHVPGSAADEGAMQETAAAAARAAFLEWVGDGGVGGRHFLETRIVPARAGGGYDILHRADDEGAPGSLTPCRDPEDAAEIAALTADGRHRPLKTAPDLRRGWRFSGLSLPAVWEVLAHLYPSAAVHWHMGRAGQGRPVSFRETAARQTGLYRPLRDAPADVAAAAMGACCRPTACLRRVAWSISPEEAHHDDSRDLDGAAVPCFEPCSVLLTRVLVGVGRAEGPPREPRA